MGNYKLKSSRNCNPKELNLIKDFFEWQGLTLESTRSTGDVLTVTKGRHGCVLFRDDEPVAKGFLAIVEYLLSIGYIRCCDDPGRLKVDPAVIRKLGALPQSKRRPE